jgi:hypothetical protein
LVSKLTWRSVVQNHVLVRSGFNGNTGESNGLC